VTLTKVPSDSDALNRLPFKAGDRVYTSYVGGEGAVRRVESLYMTIILDDGREVKIPSNGIMTGTIHVALVNPSSESRLKLSIRISWDAERTIKAIGAEAALAPDIFRSPLQVFYSSLSEEKVELEVSGEVDGARKAEARSRLIRAAYLAKGGPD
jgi:small-conductance mechanosensitive channel